MFLSGRFVNSECVRAIRLACALQKVVNLYPPQRFVALGVHDFVDGIPLLIFDSNIIDV